MRDDKPEEDAGIAGLLQAAGKRDAPPVDFARELKASLRSEWQATVARRSQVRRRWAVAGAVVAAVAVLGVSLSLWLTPPADEPVARIARVTGDVSWRGAAGATQMTGANQLLDSGDRLTTRDTGRVALAFNDGVSLRLDRDTDVVIDSAGQVTLAQGAVYVDAGRNSNRNSTLVVATPYGSVRHLGTQYEIRVLDQALRVGVREGQIELRRSDGSLQGSAGEQLIVSASGNVERLRLAADAEDWAWAGAIAPAFEIDNRPLGEFLVWAGRESGRDIAFASPASQAAASRVILRGSVAGLSPDHAIDAVLATTSLRAERSPGRVTIRD